MTTNAPSGFVSVYVPRAHDSTNQLMNKFAALGLQMSTAHKAYGNIQRARFVDGPFPYVGEGKNFYLMQFDLYGRQSAYYYFSADEKKLIYAGLSYPGRPTDYYPEGPITVEMLKEAAETTQKSQACQTGKFALYREYSPQEDGVIRVDGIEMLLLSLGFYPSQTKGDTYFRNASYRLRMCEKYLKSFREGWEGVTNQTFSKEGYKHGMECRYALLGY